MKKLVAILLMIVLVLSSLSINTFAENDIKTVADAKTTENTTSFDLGYELGSAFLIEASSGRVLYASNEYKEASPASVTKVMTLLLICEALESGRFTLSDTVLISEHAASMGGSQVFLEEGERISVEDLIKSTVIASGNDSSVALAELLAGSEAEFVRIMNRRAKELGLKNTNFENCTGLDDTTVNHYTCSADIATMTRELLRHPIILKYSSTWQDSIRDGEFTLTNTNRLVRYYDGCNGLKTGSTDKAGFCISATAKRGNMQLIAVIMGAKSKDDRNNAARMLLDYGFANFELYEREECFIKNLPVKGGCSDFVSAYSSPISICIEKSKVNKISTEVNIPDSVYAPIVKGESVGKIKYKLDGEDIYIADIFVKENISKVGFLDIFERILKRIICG